MSIPVHYYTMLIDICLVAGFFIFQILAYRQLEEERQFRATQGQWHTRGVLEVLGLELISLFFIVVFLLMIKP